MTIENKFKIMCSVKQIEEGFAHSDLYTKQQLIEYFEVKYNTFDTYLRNNREYLESKGLKLYSKDKQLQMINKLEYNPNSMYKASSNYRLLFNKESIIELVYILPDTEVIEEIKIAIDNGVELDEPMFINNNIIAIEETENKTNNKLDFIFEGNQVEIIKINDKIYFNPYDIGKCLGIGYEGIRTSMRKMNNSQIVKLTNNTFDKFSDGGIRPIRKLNNAGENFLTLNGVFYMVFRSIKDDAILFQNWVTDEVLPKIFTNGYYIDENINTKQILQLQNEVNKKTIEINQLREQIKQERSSKLYNQTEIVRYINIKGLLSPMLSIFLVVRGLGTRELKNKYQVFKPNDNMHDLALENYVHRVGSGFKFNKEFADVVNQHSDIYFPILEKIKKEYLEIIELSKRNNTTPF